MSMSTDSTRQLLRHTVATVAYRAGKALRGSPNHFSSFHIGDKTRTPAQILAHMGDLFDWALSIAQGKPAWHDSTPLPWNADITRSARRENGSVWIHTRPGPVIDARKSPSPPKIAVLIPPTISMS